MPMNAEDLRARQRRLVELVAGLSQEESLLAEVQRAGSSGRTARVHGRDPQGDSRT